MRHAVLLTKLTAVSIGRAIPLLGGIIGGSIDAATTAKIGRVACRSFLALRAV